MLKVILSTKQVLNQDLGVGLPLFILMWKFSNTLLHMVLLFLAFSIFFYIWSLWG